MLWMTVSTAPLVNALLTGASQSMLEASCLLSSRYFDVASSSSLAGNSRSKPSPKSCSLSERCLHMKVPSHSIRTKSPARLLGSEAATVLARHAASGEHTRAPVWKWAPVPGPHRELVEQANR